jgi:putative hemin transport protein
MSLRQRWNELKNDHPRMRIRDAAAQLTVSEMELVATGCGEEATRLKGPWPTLMERLESLGEVMALTRNEQAVHEKVGPYLNIKITPHVGLVLGEKIDLRIFPGRWKHGFAVIVQTPRGPRQSLQFFDAHGQAVHKIYRRKETDGPAWDALVADHTAAEQSAAQDAPLPAPAPVLDNPEPDSDSFLSQWRGLRDTHHFFAMLKKHKLTRRQAIHLGEGEFTRRVASSCTQPLLEAAAEQQVPIMVFVGSPGCIQIHTGLVKRIAPMGNWINVMDPGFNLHLRQDLVAEAWVVKKPTEDGVVTSLELLDKNGGVIAQFFGARKPGNPELEEWRGLLGML